ncbi:MAG: AAA family ATPase [Bacteroidales bacterium]|nr:AAA family ATPase [Bacteroidales bacterium]
MGIYLNPSNVGFKEILAGDIFVDKTMLISELNKFIDKGNKYICVSRPRRFGKTIATNIMCAYYSKGCDSREMFSKLKISKAKNYEQYLNKLNFIKIDVASEYQNARVKDEMLIDLQAKLLREFRAQFPKIKFRNNETLANCMMEVYSATGETFVIILDEYDCLVRNQFGTNLFADYLEFLNGLFKSDTLKPAIALAYLTGILPIVRDRVQSKLNNFREYTILDAYNLAEFVGFTEKEVKPLCKKYKVDFAQCKKEYDGYAQNGFEIYNPESVVMCMETKKFGNFWGKTSTYMVITDRLKHNYKGAKEDVVKMLSGEEVKVNITRYMNTMTDFHSKDDVFTYLIHLGYLAYNSKEGTCRIPNLEVRKEWNNAIEDMPEYSKTDEIIKASEDLLEQTLLKNSDAVAKALDNTHIHVTSNRNFNNEDALAAAVYIAFVHALNYYNCFKELSTGKGFADLVYVPVVKSPEHPAIIIELKHNQSTGKALQQIQSRQYFDALENYKGNLIFVAINYDKETKKHECEITEWEKSL